MFSFAEFGPYSEYRSESNKSNENGSVRIRNTLLTIGMCKIIGERHRTSRICLKRCLVYIVGSLLDCCVHKGNWFYFHLNRGSFISNPHMAPPPPDTHTQPDSDNLEFSIWVSTSRKRMDSLVPIQNNPSVSHALFPYVFIQLSLAESSNFLGDWTPPPPPPGGGGGGGGGGGPGPFAETQGNSVKYFSPLRLPVGIPSTLGHRDRRDPSPELRNVNGQIPKIRN